MFAWLAANWASVLSTALTVVGAASVFVKTVAPLTKWTGDDKFGAFLEKVLRWVGAIALNPAPTKAP
jgi:hypothetical protein